MKIEFENRARGTRSGFAHDTEVYIDGVFSGKYSLHYLNRTWESYTFQSVMRQAMHEMIDNEVNRLRNEVKASLGKSRLPKDYPVSSDLLDALIKRKKEL